MWLAGAILLAIFVLPGTWDAPVIVAGGLAEAAEGILWFRWSRRKRATVGAEALEGKAAVVTERLDPVGQVKVDGELWRARTTTADPLEVGSAVRVVALEELTLMVEPD